MLSRRCKSNKHNKKIANVLRWPGFFFYRPAEISGWKNVLFKFIAVLDVLHSKEYAAKNNREDQKESNFLVIAHLRMIHSESHCKAACYEYPRIECSPPNVEHIASCSKSIEIHVPVD